VLHGNSSTMGGRLGQHALRGGSDSVDDDASSEDRFGTSLAAADFDNDGYTDLLVGTPYEDMGSQTDSELAQVIWGSSSGLGEGRASSVLTQTDFWTDRHSR
jgi:FG-GAP repeat